MPFTTMSNYNWLFNTAASDSAAPIMAESTPDTHQPRVDEHLPTSREVYDKSGMSQLSNLAAPFDLHNSQGIGYDCEVSSRMPAQPVSYNDEIPFQPIGNDCDESQVEVGPYGQTLRQFPAPTTSNSPQTNTPHAIQGATQRFSEAASSGSIFSDSLDRTPDPVPSISYSGPKIGLDARERLLDLILRARAETPEGIRVTRDHHLLGLFALQKYCDAFFNSFNICYPLINRALFEPEEAESSLLLAMLLLGATYCGKSAHMLAVCIHDVMRPQIFSHCGFSASPELWMLQTILLVECFGKSRAGQKQHDMAHLFHGLLIK